MMNHASTACPTGPEGSSPGWPAHRLLLATLLPALAAGAVILLRAWLTADGYLSSDSRFYLAAATNLARGLGGRVANDGSAPATLEPFADWPVGYPTLIWLFGRATGLAAFAAAKALAIVLLAACAWVIHRVFGRDGPICALPLVFASTLEIFSFSWSEGPFIALLVASAGLLAAAWSAPGRFPAAKALLLGLCCAGLFLCRYVGAFALVLPVLAALPALRRRDWRSAAACLAALVFAGLVVAAYLAHNLALTGYATGMPRKPPTDSPWSRLAMLGGAVWSQLVVATVMFRASDWLAWIAVAVEAAGLAAIVRAVRRGTPVPLRRLRLDAASGAFLTVGLLYLGAIVVLRWRNQFDPYDFRLLGPGSVLVEIGLLRLALTSWPAARRTVAATALALAALSLAFALAALPRPWQPRYAEAVAAIRQRYAALPPGAIVVFGSGHLHYLRPDLFVAMPLCPPWFVEHETWAQFVGRLDHAHPIFVDMRQPPLDLRACDTSIRRAVTRYPAGAVTPLVASAG